MNANKLITLAAVAASAAILPMTSNAKTVYWKANAGGDITDLGRFNGKEREQYGAFALPG